MEPQLKPISFVFEDADFIFSKAIVGNGFEHWFDIPSVPKNSEYLKQQAFSDFSERIDSSTLEQSDKPLLHKLKTEDELRAHIRELRKKRNLIQRAESYIGSGRLTFVEDDIKYLIENKEQILAELADVESLLWGVSAKNRVS